MRYDHRAPGARFIRARRTDAGWIYDLYERTVARTVRRYVGRSEAESKAWLAADPIYLAAKAARP